MEVNGVLPTSAQPVQEGQELTRPNREGGDAAAFAALLYFILGTPQAETGSTGPTEVKAVGTEASVSGGMPIWKGSGALAIANGEPTDPRAFLTNDIFTPPAVMTGAVDGAGPTPMLTELAASGAQFDSAVVDGSAPKSAGENDASIGGGGAQREAVSEIKQDSIEALTPQASAHGNPLSVANDAARVVRDPPVSASIGVTVHEVETDSQAEPERTFAKFALAKGNVIRRVFAINIETETGKVEQPTMAGATGQVVASSDLSNHVEPELATEPTGKNHPDLKSGGQFELALTTGAAGSDAQADPAYGQARQAPTGSTVGRDSAINIEPFDQAQGRPGTRNIEREGTGGGPGNLSTQVEPELATEPTGKNHPDLRSGGLFKLGLTTGAAGSDSQVPPAPDSEKLAPGTSNPIRLVHGAGQNSTRAEEESVPGPAEEIHAGAELAGKFQFGKTADGHVAEHEARLIAEADTKTNAPSPGRGPAQRLSDIAAPVPRTDVAADKLGSVGDPAPASWRSAVNRVAEEMASQVKLNKREAVIQLDPPELGRIKIDLRIEGDKLEARIVAEVHESRVLIENHLQELRQALRLQHLDLADVRVSQDGWSGGSGDPMLGSGQQQPDGEPQRARNAQSAAGPASATAERSEGGDSIREKGRVSMWA